MYIPYPYITIICSHDIIENSHEIRIDYYGRENPINNDIDRIHRVSFVNSEKDKNHKESIMNLIEKYLDDLIKE
ncbi:MAG TPA: hypothetical protein VNU45_19135 [Rummeliibacillus sp.]|nr:hypothetical protein [Rummeliibacillus sp.]